MWRIKRALFALGVVPLVLLMAGCSSADLIADTDCQVEGVGGSLSGGGPWSIKGSGRASDVTWRNVAVCTGVVHAYIRSPLGSSMCIGGNLDWCTAEATRTPVTLTGPQLRELLTVQ